MTRRPTAAGGFFLIIAIFAGTFWGISGGQPSLGFLIGLAGGTALAVVVWLIDRRR